MHKSYYEKRSVYNPSGGRMRHILDLVPSTPSYILDVGCGAGILAAELKMLGHVVDGIDISANAIERSRPHVRAGYCFDIVHDSWPKELEQKKFDVIIISEVIEHLFEPQALLEKAKFLLKKGGYLIVTTPNVLFWKNRFKMFFGSFEYQSEGIMDFSHIRFFTVESARDFIKQAEYWIEREHHLYPNLYKRKLNFMGKLLPGLFAYQLIFLLSNEKKY